MSHYCVYAVMGALLVAVSSINAEVIGYAPGAAQNPGLYQINMQTGAATFLTAVQPTPASGGMGFLAGGLYMTDYFPVHGSAQAYYGSVNPATGAFTPIGLQTSNNWFGLTADTAGGFFYVLDGNDSTLLRFTPGGAITTIGVATTSNPDGFQGMAYDNVHGILYASDYYEGSPNLYTIDTSTGAATLIGSLGLPPATAGGGINLAYDDSTQVLYAFNDVSDSLMRVDIATGAATTIGPSGGIPVDSIAIVPVASTPLPSSAWGGLVLLGGLGLMTVLRHRWTSAI